jgi:MFS superfamily sulfate permease-like transporter
MVVDLLRGLLAGAATVLLMWSLPSITPFIGIPVCVLAFLGLSVAVGLVNRADIELLGTMFRKPAPRASALRMPISVRSTDESLPHT